ncbi:MAG: phytanoyl-CoA dioxygenase [Solirubrobacterales bacterium]|nr:phytanoyl-CoA dioxygenase [Solirubrobacterales bacterium]
MRRAMAGRSASAGEAPISAQDVERFRRDGAIVLRGVLDGDQVAGLAAGVDRNLADPSELAIRTESSDGPGAFFEDFCNWQRIDEFERTIRSAPLAAVAGTLTGATEVRLFHDHVLVKEPGTTAKTPWHQDQPYYCIDGTQNVSFWIPLDPVPREATLEFVAGSQAGGTWYMPRSFVEESPMVFDPGELEEVPEIEADREAHEILGWELEPGDAVAFHMLTLHAAAGSRSRRRAFSLRLLGDDITFGPRPHRTSPPFPGLERELDAGEPMDHPLFPVLWRAPEG